MTTQTPAPKPAHRSKAGQRASEREAAKND